MYASSRNLQLGSCYLKSTSSDEIRGITAHLFSIEYVDHSQLLDRRITESRQWQMHPCFFEFFGQHFPGRARWCGADQCDVGGLGVQARCGQKALFKRRGKIEPRVNPDIGNRHGGKQEQGSAIVSQTNSWANRFFQITACKKRQG